MEFQETIESARGSFAHSCDRLTALLLSTPSDKLNWSPAPSARSAVQVAAHAAWAIHDINEMLCGRTVAFNTTEEADAFFRQREEPYSSSDEVLELLKKHSAEFQAILDGLTPESLASSITLPFGMGTAPLGFALTFQSLHMNDHNGQLSYIQTIYGDRVWH